jgi:acetyl esterase/lipase
MNAYSKINASKDSKPLLYFSVEYPLACDAGYPAQRDVVVAAYKWLVEDLGVKNVIIGGDSAVS